MIRRLLLAGVIVQLSCIDPALAQTNPADAASRAIRNEAVQTELPTEETSQRSSLSLPRELIDLMLWGAVIVGVVTIGFALRDSLPAFDRSRRIVAAGEEIEGPSGPDLMGVAQTEADELAALGRYAEAMHVLLLRALAELRERLRVSFADSLTSREILRRAPLDEAGGQAFARIIGKVELTHFGEVVASEGDYVACRGQFEALRRSLGVMRAT